MGQHKTIPDTENEKIQQPKQEYVRSKMEAMQKRIDELKEKVKNEGELLHNEASFDADIFGSTFQDSLCDLQNSFEQNPNENEISSDKSLYYSASNYSLGSLSTSSTDTAYNNFTKFVNNFVKNQNHKERLSLLQLHSKKQISLNMMRHSLSELDSRCSEELELVERSLHHLNRLATEFGIFAQNNEDAEDGKLKAIEFYSTDNEKSKKQKIRSNPVFIWPHEERKSKMNMSSNYSLLNLSTQDNCNSRD